MDELTFYSYKMKKGEKIQVYITINFNKKIFITNENQEGFDSTKYGFSVYELKDYSELQYLKRCLLYRGFNQEKVEF